jgi:hypothetical protein
MVGAHRKLHGPGCDVKVSWIPQEGLGLARGRGPTLGNSSRLHHRDRFRRLIYSALVLPPAVAISSGKASRRCAQLELWSDLVLG